MSSQYVPPQQPQPTPPQAPGAVAPQSPAPGPARAEGEKQNWAWVGGAILIIVGLAVLFGNFGFLWGNWWSLIFFLFAVVNFVSAARSWERAGNFNKAAAGSLTGGLVLTAIGAIFLLDLAWGAWWPLILVAIGTGIVLGALLGAITGAAPQ